MANEYNGWFVLHPFRGGWRDVVVGERELISELFYMLHVRAEVPLIVVYFLLFSSFSVSSSGSFCSLSCRKTKLRSDS